MISHQAENSGGLEDPLGCFCWGAVGLDCIKQAAGSGTCMLRRLKIEIEQAVS